MKSIFKLIGGLFIGIVAGLAIAAAIIVFFTDTTFAEYIQNMLSTDGAETIMAALVAMISFIIALAILIPIHETGHLFCGLLSGYEFVSFRIFNLTFIKANGKIKLKHYAVAGTGGQCLLTPPDLPLEKIPTGWYNAGGVLANIVILLLILPLFFLNLHPFMFEALVIFCFTDLFLILTNGIPMKLGGISNDGYSILYLNRKSLSKKAFTQQLRSNALIQNGIRPKDMPDEWFEWLTDIDFKNPLEVSIPFMHASRLVDRMMWKEAYSEFSELYSHKAEIIQLYANEIACELAFCAIMTRRYEQAAQLLDLNLRKYIEKYKTVMSSKLRILCSISLYLDNDRAKAEKIYATISANQDKYLLQGEVKSDLTIMDWMLNNHQQQTPT